MNLQRADAVAVTITGRQFLIAELIYIAKSVIISMIP